MSQRVKDLDLKAIHNHERRGHVLLRVSQRVKDLDLKAIHNDELAGAVADVGVTACQRS